MIKIPTLIYYLTIVIVFAVLTKYITLSDWEYWVVIAGFIIARMCGKEEH